MQFETHLRDLEGRPGITSAVFVESRTAALRVARAGRAVTSAGSTGAINIWRDRKRVLHASFMRFCVTVDHSSGMTFADLARWLKKYWPEMGQIG